MAAPRLPPLTLPALELAPRLLGCVVVRVDDRGQRQSAVIVETEAYPGGLDRASHTYGGRRTQRNAAMWEVGGTLYVYFTYGMHHCMNVVSGPAGSGEAVLIRAAEPWEGIDVMRARRPAGSLRDLCRGPARLCQALGIDRQLDGTSLAESGPVGLLPPRRASPGRVTIRSGPRVGVGYAGPWAAKPWRFWVAGSSFVS